MHEFLAEQIKQCVSDTYDYTLTEVVIDVPDEKFGDYATSVALALAKNLKKSPIEIANTIAVKLKNQSSFFSEVEVVKPGFVNVRLKDKVLWERLEQPLEPQGSLGYLQNKRVAIEYSDPNPFKVLHVGHLYTSLYGRSLVNLFKFAGAEVFSLNFGGDIGLHVAKTLWAIMQRIDGEKPDALKSVEPTERSRWMTQAYIEGNNAYEEQPDLREEINSLNKRVYAIHSTDDHTSSLAQIYWICREWSYEYFEDFYERLDIHFDKFYPESEVAQLGLDKVREQLDKGVFEESDGAIVYRGEKKGLHTRVFINKQGLPTYEAKDVGLILAKEREFKPDISIIDTGNEQLQYMEVVLAAISEFEPDLVAKTKHVTHGMVKLQGGVKMSSRKGNILEASEVIQGVIEELKGENQTASEELALGAITYGLLKTRAGGDIVFDPKESVSSKGNSGVYLQYTYARLHSIMSSQGIELTAKKSTTVELDTEERSLARTMLGFDAAIVQSIEDLSPHHLCAYLHELSQKTNHFYERNRVIGHEREAMRIALVNKIVAQLKLGMRLLGIAAPKRV